MYKIFILQFNFFTNIMDEYSLKLDKYLMPIVSNIDSPVILEFGVENGRSTKKILEICRKKMIMNLSIIRNYMKEILI